MYIEEIQLDIFIENWHVGSFVKTLIVYKEYLSFLCGKILLKFYSFRPVGEIPRPSLFLAWYEPMARLFSG